MSCYHLDSRGEGDERQKSLWGLRARPTFWSEVKGHTFFGQRFSSDDPASDRPMLEEIEHARGTLARIRKALLNIR
jgi:hypothetical protein